MRRQKLLNHTDFQCFQSEYGRKHFFFQADWKQENSQLVFTISANRFLRNMVRSIVGTLVNIGIHKITLDDFNSIIESKNRDKAGFRYRGLYLTEIDYDYINKPS
jgi:tRNA pseudouridine38-40 synthase